jgi:protein-S-isoprenylcysteine O-methyltransferase Ste14
MGTTSYLGRVGAVLALWVAAAEILIMISPFAGLFFTSLGYEPLLGVLSQSRLTFWLDGFFLNHAVVTNSPVLESHRWAGRYLFALGIWGFVLCALQVYGHKVLRRGIARGLLYRLVRHPQYLCLALAGWGLLTIWPRFLLLGVWVTMLFLYAGLARFEEGRMQRRFGDAYVQYKASTGAFFPGSPVQRLFEHTFGKLRPRVVGWAAAYVVCLALAFSVGFGLRALTRAHTAIVWEPQDQMAVISAWPKPDSWLHAVIDAALHDERVRDRLAEARQGRPVVATILPPLYFMRGMYYKRGPMPYSISFRSMQRLRSIALRFLLPVDGFVQDHFMGVDPDSGFGAVEIVFSRAEKPYTSTLPLAESLDAGVRTTPLVVAMVLPSTQQVWDVFIPLPQNVWGPKVVMPLL